MSEVKGHGYRAIAATLLGGVLAITAARATDAQDPPNAREGRPTCNQDRPPSPAGLFGPGGPSDFGEDRPPPYLRDLALGEDQQDKIFAILHAAAPAMRDHMKAARKARDALRDFAQSSAFTNEKATALAQTQSAAEAQVSLLQVRTDHDIMMVLTPEQRAHVAERLRDHDTPPREGPLRH